MSLVERENRSLPSAELELRAVAECRWDLLALGEVLLRFDPGEERISRTRHFRVWEGGGEYNVARGARRCFGLRTTIATALVDNPVGRLVEDLMLEGGVDLSHVLWSDFDGVGKLARNGVYFLERGLGVRRGLGMMDRGHTAIAQVDPGAFDWDAIFRDEGVRIFHTGGIMAGLSETATEVVRQAMMAARRHGVAVSFDCNYRPSVWASRGGRRSAIEVNRSLMPMVNVLFGHEGDLAEDLSEASKGPVWHTAETFREMAERVLEDFPHLEVLASTVRKPLSASRNSWSGFAYAQGTAHAGIVLDEMEILDRVGGGDGFASGLIYGLLGGKGLPWALNCGIAHGALTMTTPGDSSQVTLAEVEQVMAGASAHTVR